MSTARSTGKRTSLRGPTILVESLKGLLNENNFRFQTLIKRLGVSNPSILFSAHLLSVKADLVKKMIPRKFLSESHLDWLDSNLKAGNFSDSQFISRALSL